MYTALSILVAGGLICAGIVYARLPTTSAPTTSPTVVALGTVIPETFTSFISNQAPILIDVRTPEEYADAHLTNAINLDFYSKDFVAQLSELDRTKPYAIYCRSGNRTSETLRIMRDLGFTYVYDLGGGILAWEAAGYPTCNTITC
jgi:rhodanese-related sulfurtransferase